MTQALFVISTGRCGTQWLADVLATQLGPAAEVAHEPLDSDYSARVMLAAGDPARLDPNDGAPILAHVAHIERTLEKRHYVECGWPLWSTLPHLLERFAGRARVIHLVRHPVPTALSWLTHRAYIPPLMPHLAEKILLAATDDGVQFPHWGAMWSSLTPYEKALYWWLEVNAFALRLEARTTAPWLRVRFEDMPQPAMLDAILDFAGAPRDHDPLPGAIDEFRSVLESWPDPSQVSHHPDVIRTAAVLGYDALAFDASRLRARYCPHLRAQGAGA